MYIFDKILTFRTNEMQVNSQTTPSILFLLETLAFEKFRGRRAPDRRRIEFSQIKLSLARVAYRRFPGALRQKFQTFENRYAISLFPISREFSMSKVRRGAILPANRQSVPTTSRNCPINGIVRSTIGSEGKLLVRLLDATRRGAGLSAGRNSMVQVSWKTFFRIRTSTQLKARGKFCELAAYTTERGDTGA